MSPLQTCRTAARACAAMFLSLVLGTCLAQPAPAEGADAGKTNTSVAAPPGAARGVHVSPHALAARKRAAAQAQAGPADVHVSRFTTRRKPQTLASGR